MPSEEESNKDSRPLGTSQTSTQVLGKQPARVQLCKKKGKRRTRSLLNSKYLELESGFLKW